MPTVTQSTPSWPRARERGNASKARKMIGITSLVRELLENASTEEAAEALLARAHRDDSLAAALTSDGLRAACFSAVRRVVAADRHAVWNEPTAPPAAQRRPDFQAWSGSIEHSLFRSFSLTTGVALGDGREEDIDKTIHWHRTRIEDMTSKIAFLDLIRAKLKPGKTVAQSMTVDEVDAFHLQAIRTEAGNA